MDHQTKLVDNANAERERLKEELITVYLRLEQLPNDSLPEPKPALVPSYSGQGEPAHLKEPGQPVPTPEVLLTLMAFTQQKARNGDSEAQKMYDQLTDAPDVLSLLTAASQEEPAGAVSPAQPSIG
eukprot:6473997-Amphidinium_carterae.1